MVIIREELCIGCWTCTAFCPYGVIYPAPERRIALKCDRCLYMEMPVCVDVCPTKALEVVEIDGIDEQLRQKRSSAAKAASEQGGEGIRLLNLGKP
jgi:carbon-monoxide dehydrogenase iron sulfur subunit